MTASDAVHDAERRATLGRATRDQLADGTL